MSISYLTFGIVCAVTLMITPCAFGDANSGQKIVQFQLKVNQTAFEPDNISIKFLNVTEDSRCPSGVTCIWQGKSTIIVNVMKNNQNLGNSSLTSGLGNNDATVAISGGYILQVIQMAPYPTSGVRIPISDYIVTFTISKSGMLSPLEQFRSGTNAKQVECMTGLQLVIKSENNSPACVLPSSVSVLMARGWAITDVATQ
ncbi:MAG TPA: hypothetical protein VJ571_08490 [Candidatus Nitrosotalea sp.]|nr:hypothetical protein [Candidatus Nitrosotalea sp.]